jgi:hypothetical protein
MLDEPKTDQEIPPPEETSVPCIMEWHPHGKAIGRDIRLDE